MLIDVKTKEELNLFMDDHTAFPFSGIAITFGSKWGLRKYGRTTEYIIYHLITYEKEHQRNTRNKVLTSQTVTDEEAFKLILKVRREENLNNILS